MKLETKVQVALAILVSALVMLIIVKPSIDNKFHEKYIENLTALDNLSESLVRKHWELRNGQTNHYDYLETDLQKMERFAQLAAFPPMHTDKDVLNSAQTLSAEYLTELSNIRDYVELSKRGIGLLNNSTRTIDMLLTQLNNHPFTGGNHSSDVFSLIVKLNQAYRERSDFNRIRSLLDDLSAKNVVDSQLIAKLVMHTKTLESVSGPVEEATKSLYEATEALYQPRQIQATYLTDHNAVVVTTAWLLWASYAVAALLVMLAALQNIVANRARRAIAMAMQEADAARKDSEARITQTRKAVERCNTLLEKIGNGNFSDRIEEEFTDELEQLRLGVNRAADSVQYTTHELHRILGRMQRGDFTSEIDERVTGEFRDQVEQTNKRIQAIMVCICDVMDSMSKGDFSARIEIDLEGSFGALKKSVNESMTSLSDSLVEIASVVDKQATGDFVSRVEGGWPGDLGALSQSLNRTGDVIYKMVVEVQQLSEDVASTSQIVLQNSSTLKSQSDQQAAAIDAAMQTANSVRNLIEENRTLVDAASELAANSQKEANDCLLISNNSAEVMRLVTDKIAAIDNSASTIKVIASKTNLLALNATVEASRAGDSGKGFSVVADEVKALARLSAASSADIADLVQNTANEARRSSSAADDAKDTLAGIGKSVGEVRDINQKIVDSSLLQLGELESMNGKVGEAYELTQTNIAMTAEANKTSENLDGLARKMTSLVEFFSGGEKQHNPIRKAA